MFSVRFCVKSSAFVFQFSSRTKTFASSISCELGTALKMPLVNSNPTIGERVLGLCVVAYYLAKSSAVAVYNFPSEIIFSHHIFLRQSLHLSFFPRIWGHGPSLGHATTLGCSFHSWGFCGWQRWEFLLHSLFCDGVCVAEDTFGLLVC